MVEVLDPFDGRRRRPSEQPQNSAEFIGYFCGSLGSQAPKLIEVFKSLKTAYSEAQDCSRRKMGAHHTTVFMFGGSCVMDVRLRIQCS